MRVRVFVILFGGFKVTFHQVRRGHGVNDGLVQNMKFFASMCQHTEILASPRFPPILGKSPVFARVSNTPT